MHFEVLGSAGAAPLAGACSSYLVTSERATVLLDCGPGTLERLHRRDLIGRLDAIVISHMHMDHVLDLLPLTGAVVTRMWDGRRPVLHVPGGDGPTVLAALGAVFGDELRVESALTVAEYDADDTLTIGDLTLTFAPTAHAAPCFAARVTDGRATVVYGADGGPSDAVTTLAQDADLLVLEATFADEEAQAAAHGHMTAAQAGTLASAAAARRLLLTHLLPGVPEQELIGRAQATYAGPVQLAHEGYGIDL
jgi:ribonuclease BN (tRNA processing enzyme)